MSFATVAVVGGIGLSIYGTTQERKGIEIEGKAQEAAMRFNAAQNRRKAERTREAGAEAEFQIRRNLRQQIAENKVQAAGANVVLGEGAPLDVELLNIRAAASDIATLSENIKLAAADTDLLASFQDEQAGSIGDATGIAKKAATASGIGKILSPLAGLF